MAWCKCVIGPPSANPLLLLGGDINISIRDSGGSWVCPYSRQLTVVEMKECSGPVAAGDPCYSGDGAAPVDSNLPDVVTLRGGWRLDGVLDLELCDGCAGPTSG